MSDRMDVNRLLLEMRAMKAQSQAFATDNRIIEADRANPAQGPNHIANKNGPQFSDLFSQAIDKVNDVQQASSSMGQAYMRGDPNVSITDVMIAGQKASVAFDATVQVRNKFVEAYKDIMNMPI